MSDESLQREVLAELGDDRIQELAGELGTDAEGARTVVGTTVAALPSTLGDGTLAGVLGRLTEPTAETVSRQTGLPLASVTRALELLLPVVLSVIAKRRGSPSPSTHRG
ncbi:DUF937 domain-containing protein [Streptomyces sp. NPDC002055]|uniref:DUF937 domain-containing protein n=1 Tax=Streptomyces sp. NPDC002055 TaxID=3154534 RepID=UPI003321DEAC